MTRIAKVARVIDYIETNLTNKFDLDMIADAVHYSKYHLHRMFSETLGITLHEYIQRRQLTEAAKLLVFSEKSILDIALLSGYGSQQAFHGIFKSMYKLSPNQYRENEKFYPLQLKIELGENFQMSEGKGNGSWNITYATEEDIPCWMDLVRLVIDGYPHLQEDEYAPVLKQYIKNHQAMILKDGPMAIGIMLFSHNTGSIDFMGTHPLYRKRGIPKAFLDKVIRELLHNKEISITTYREGDKADTGYRKQIMDLGFAEAELLVEFGYPTQRFVLSTEDDND